MSAAVVVLAATLAAVLTRLWCARHGQEAAEPAAAAFPELAYVPETGLVVRRLQDGRWYLLDVLPGGLGAEAPPGTAVRYRPLPGG